MTRTLRTTRPPLPLRFTVNNIKNLIILTLDQEDDQYASWVELFHIHTCAYNVLDHIDSTVERPSNIDSPTWQQLDAIVKQWIYSMISKDLLHTIMKLGASAKELWVHLEEIFQDNKHTCVVYLEEQFNTTRLEAFPIMTEYCKRLKQIADQLANVGSPITEAKMVLQLANIQPHQRRVRHHCYNDPTGRPSFKFQQGPLSTLVGGNTSLQTRDPHFCHRPTVSISTNTKGSVAINGPTTISSTYSYREPWKRPRYLWLWLEPRTSP